MSTERPGILTAIAILGIILGALGLIGSLMSVGGILLQGQMLDLPGAGDIVEAQRQLAEQITEITRAYIVPTVVGAVANFVVCVLLILGGAWLLARKPAGIGLMTGTVAAAVVVDLYNTALAAYVQVKVMPLTEQMMRAAAADMPPGADAAMDSVMSAALWAGMAVTVFWLLCKLAYYIVALVALKKPAVKDWVAEGAVA